MLGAPTLARRFPMIDRVTRERGFDWAREPIPVTPAAHYLMGGIATDLDGRTTMPGLFAVGEAARTGVHGANRLASNSLLEGAVFGARAAAAIGAPWPRPQAPEPRAIVEDAATPISAPFSRDALQRLMWDEVGLLRTDDGLRLALATIRAWSAALPTPIDVAAHEDANLLVLAEATASAALLRTASVGAHFREPALIGV
jgi:L-aspartate oxidase